MVTKQNKLKIDIDYAIREYKLNRNEEYLAYLFVHLKKEPLLIALEKSENYSMGSDVQDSSIPRFNPDKFPTIVVSENNEFWFSCFTSYDKIPATFIEKYDIVETTLKDLIIETLSNNDISGLAINHKTTLNLNIRKDIFGIFLKFIDKDFDLWLQN